MGSDAAVRATAQSTDTGRLLLLVDDEEGVLRSLSRFFRREGYRVETAKNAEAALDLLRNGSAPQVLISDYRMPGMDGVTFLRLVRDTWPRIQRVLMTGFADMQAIESAINDSQIYRFLAKPWDDSNLLATVRSAVHEWELHAENERLQELTREQNRQLAEANRDLEAKVQVRTHLLSRAKREWEVAFDAITDPVMLIDRDYRLIRANLSLAQHLGRDVKSLPGQVCHELRASSPNALPRDGAGPCNGCPVAASRLRGAPESVELETQNDRVLSLAAFPIVDDERQAVVCRYHDLTAERQMHRQLAQADKLSALGLLAGGVAHEVNNPLGAILAFAQLLRREAVEPEEHDDYLREIEESAVRCKQIVERLLRFARQGKREDRLRTFSFNDVVTETSFLVEKSYLTSGVNLTRELEPELWQVAGNPNEISQVLLNLVTNARDAMPSGGKIRVRTRNVTGENAVELSVLDEGPGMSPEVVKRIFDPFFTTKPEGKGTGLGLAVSYGIVKDHHGRIDVKTRPGEGTEFLVVLPRALTA